VHCHIRSPGADSVVLCLDRGDLWPSRIASSYRSISCSNESARDE